MARPSCAVGGGVLWYAYCSCMRQASEEGVEEVLPSGTGAVAGAGEMLTPARALAALDRAGSRAFGLLCPGLLSARASRASGSFGSAFGAVRFARLLPDLARGVGLLAGPLGLALGLFDPLSGALELLLGDADPLPGYLRLQPRALQRLRRLCCRGCPRRGSVRAPSRARRLCAGRSLFSCCLAHAKRGWWQRAASVTQWPCACHRDFIHRFCE